MKLKMLNLEFTWPEQVSPKGLRRWIREQISNHGEPLRWAITSVEILERTGAKKIRLEAMVIISEHIGLQD